MSRVVLWLDHRPRSIVSGQRARAWERFICWEVVQCTRRLVADRRILMGSEFACSHCGSPSVVYPDEDEDRVMCAGCGAFLATRSQFRKLIERRESHSAIQTSGC